MRTMTRTRLSPDARREQLLAAGAQLFASRPYDEVRIEEIADAAGVSRGLLYRYFATKRELFRAIVQQATEQVFALTAPDPELPTDASAREAVERFIAQFEAHADIVRAVDAAMSSADSDARAILAQALRRQEDRILARLGVRRSPRLRVAVRGWLMMTRALTIDWLDRREVSRAALADICTDALLDLVARHATPAKRAYR